MTRVATNGVLGALGGAVVGTAIAGLGGDAAGLTALLSGIGAATGAAASFLGVNAKALIDTGLNGGAKEFGTELKQQWTEVRGKIAEQLGKFFDKNNEAQQ